MSEEGRIAELIEQARKVLHCGCKDHCYEDWRCDALNCLTEILGADHPYTRFFTQEKGSPDVGTLLAEVPVLMAAMDRVPRPKSSASSVQNAVT